MTTNFKVQRFEISKDIAYRCLGDEEVMLNLATCKYFGLDQVGTTIWRLIESKSSIGEIEDHLCAHYDVPPETCAEDVQVFVEALQEKKLIVPA